MVNKSDTDTKLDRVKVKVHNLQQDERVLLSGFETQSTWTTYPG